MFPVCLLLRGPGGVESGAAGGDGEISQYWQVTLRLYLRTTSQYSMPHYCWVCVATVGSGASWLSVRNVQPGKRSRHLHVVISCLLIVSKPR